MTQVLNSLKLCDGNNQDEVDNLHTWLGDQEWEGDERGITLLNQICSKCGEKGACVGIGQWMTKLPDGTILVTSYKPEQSYAPYH